MAVQGEVGHGDVPAAGTLGMQAGHDRRMFALLLMISFLAVPEVVIRDLFLGPGSYPFVLAVAVSLMAYLSAVRLLARTYRMHRSSLVVWALFCAAILLSFVSNGAVVPVLIAQPALILLFAIAFRECDWSTVSRIFFVVALLICALPVLSFIVHFLTPFKVILPEVFTDATGDRQSIVFTSFSVSIYRVGGLAIPRLSSVFDEPGTFGFFVSIFGSLLFLRKRVTLARLVLFSGLVSFSTAYLLFFVLTAPVWLTKDFRRGGVFLLVGFLGGLAILVWRATPEAVSFFGTRLLYAFGDTHDRTIGWSMAIESLKKNPLFGMYLSGYTERAVPASGALVIMAYVGAPATVALLLLVLMELAYQVRFLGYPLNDWKGIYVLGVAVLITVANRNNFFNISGYILVLFAAVAASSSWRQGRKWVPTLRWLRTATDRG
jgi:hypothetical protein